MPKPIIHIEDLKDYLAGRLDGKAMHAIEKQALEDPFLAEALEGLMEDPDQSIAGLEALKAGLKDRMTSVELGSEQTIRRGIRYWWYGVAALFVLGLGIYMMIQYQSDISGSENLTREIVRGIDQSPLQNQGVVSDSGNSLPGASGKALAIGDSEGEDKFNQSAPIADQFTGIKEPKTSKTDPGLAGPAVPLADQTGDLAKDSTGYIASAKPGQLNSANQVGQEDHRDKVALNEQPLMSRKLNNPAAAFRLNPPVSMQKMQRATNKNTDHAANKYNQPAQQMYKGEVVEGVGGGQNPLSDTVIEGHAGLPGMDIDKGTDMDKVDLENLSRNSDLVMQKSRLRTVIDRNAYDAYIEAEVNRLRSTGELDSLLKGTVLLKFLIPEDGDGKPNHISVESSDARQLSRAAKKILAKGPVWEVIPGTQAPYWGWYAVVFK